MKSWLQVNVGEMYSTHNEGKSVVAIRFIRTFNNKIYKYMNSVSRNLHIDKLADIVNGYNSTYHRKIKMKPADENLSNYFDSAENKIQNLKLMAFCH